MSFKDSELNTCKRKLTEVTAELDASDLGTLQELDTQLPELVNWDTTTEPKLIKRFTESAKAMTRKMLQLAQILPINKLLLWEDSFATELSETTSL